MTHDEVRRLIENRPCKCGLGREAGVHWERYVDDAGEWRIGRCRFRLDVGALADEIMARVAGPSCRRCEGATVPVEWGCRDCGPEP